MINYTKKKKCIDEMHAVLINPFKSLRLLKEIKHSNIPSFEFVGYLKYYLNFADKSIVPITQLRLYPTRTTRLASVLRGIDECWRLGFIDDTQKMLLKCATKTINTLIHRYILIYLFL